ncbi:hypothetical protein LUZ61_012285 [Rhynchospora tenuis]|uniref:Uncharacterized protein n=1 Tax=Rhynchospora tenuis TaxID=198213 RepID=A0AAD6F196_9POAL|nr:hypothetical protein LUZ61_012285 [Rhynchospora tenuis]
MGSCASVHKEQGAAMGVRMRLVTKAKRLFVASPSKEKEHFNGEKESKLVTVFGPMTNGGEVESCLAYKSPDFGSKDEIFYDSKAWLDSDCEDDFFSVNGEFTPSRGSTPNHPKFSPGTPRMNNLSLNEKFPDSKSEPSPRKKLAELFEEASEIDRSMMNGSIIDKNSKTEGPLEVMGSVTVDDLTTNSPYTSNGVTPNREKKKRERILNYGSRCCLPGLAGTVGIDERRQKTSPSPCTV